MATETSDASQGHPIGSEELHHCLRDADIAPQLRDLPFFSRYRTMSRRHPTRTSSSPGGFGNWLRTEAEGRRKVSEGYVNFATQLNDYILAYAIRLLLREGEGFYITDLGKCSMPVSEAAGRTREYRLVLCLP